MKVWLYSLAYCGCLFRAHVKCGVQGKSVSLKSGGNFGDVPRNLDA